MEIAEEEIERTAQEAVKAALLEVGGEMAYKEEMINQLEKANADLKFENLKLNKEISCKKKNFFYGTVAGTVIGIVTSSLIFGIVNGVIR